MPLKEVEYVQGIVKKHQETVKQDYIGDHICICLKTATIYRELFLKIWKESALLKPHALECVFPQNICADGISKVHFSALGYCNDRSHT